MLVVEHADHVDSAVGTTYCGTQNLPCGVIDEAFLRSNRPRVGAVGIFCHAAGTSFSSSGEREAGSRADHGLCDAYWPEVSPRRLPLFVAEQDSNVAEGSRKALHAVLGLPPANTSASNTVRQPRHRLLVVGLGNGDGAAAALRRGLPGHGAVRKRIERAAARAEQRPQPPQQPLENSHDKAHDNALCEQLNRPFSPSR